MSIKKAFKEYLYEMQEEVKQKIKELQEEYNNVRRENKDGEECGEVEAGVMLECYVKKQEEIEESLKYLGVLSDSLKENEVVTNGKGVILSNGLSLFLFPFFAGDKFPYKGREFYVVSEKSPVFRAIVGKKAREEVILPDGSKVEIKEVVT